MGNILRRGLIGSVVATAMVVMCCGGFALADEGSSWPDDFDCVACHTAQAKALEEESIASTHDMSCVMCHDDSQTLAKMHDDVEEGQRIPKSLKQTVVDSEVCLMCHQFDGPSAVAGSVFDPVAYEAAIEAGAEAGGSVQLEADPDGEESDGEQADEPVDNGIPLIPTGVTITDANGLEVPVHAPAANYEHALSIQCGSCHDVHVTKTADKQAKSLCTTCHHKNVYECHTCH